MHVRDQARQARDQARQGHTGPNDTIDVAIEYSGKPSRGLYFVEPAAGYPKKTLSFWTQGESEDTRCWLPCYDYPNERATSEMIITVPKPLFVLSNGVLVETKTDAGETTTYHWKMDVPHVSYLISLAGGRFRGLSRPRRRSAARLLRRQARRRGDGAAIHGPHAEDDPFFRREDRPALSV